MRARRATRKITQIPIQFWLVELAGIVVILLLASAVHAQTQATELPDSPDSPGASASSAIFPDSSMVRSLLSAPLPAETMGLTDIMLRVGDVITTYRLLNNPCRCFNEADPLAPKGGAIIPSITFQASAAAAVYFGSQFLRKHHHRKLAYALQAADIESESYAVFANNIPLLRR